MSSTQPLALQSTPTITKEGSNFKTEYETDSSEYSDENLSKNSTDSFDSTSVDTDSEDEGKEEEEERYQRTKLVPQLVSSSSKEKTLFPLVVVPQQSSLKTLQARGKVPLVPSTLPTTNTASRGGANDDVQAYKHHADKQPELKLIYKTLDGLPRTQNDQRSYFLLLNKDDVKLCDGKPKFPEHTCFGTTYSNVRDYANFFLWKKCPYALSFYEIINPPWKTKREMIAFIRCKQPIIDCYLAVLAECSNFPTIEKCADFSSWDAFLHKKTKRSFLHDSNTTGEAVHSRRRYGRRKDHRHHCHQPLDNCTKGQKRCKKGKIYFSRKRCTATTSTTGEPEYKYFICIRGGSGPHMENSIKESINQTNFDVNAYLELDKHCCSVSLYNNNRIAFGLSQYCGLNIVSGFETPCEMFVDGSSANQAFFPLIAGIPSFVQFHNRTLGMTSSSSSSASTAATDENQWLLSYNAMLNGKETAFLNDGKVAIEIPDENKIVMVPVNTKANALSFLIPSSVNSLMDIEIKRKELCAVHATEEELKAFNRSIKTVNNIGSMGEQIKIGANMQQKRPPTLKIYDLYDVS